MQRMARVLDLTGIEPTPDRLLEIAEGFASVGDDVIVDWGGRFPWSRGLVRWAFETFPEQLVSEATKKLAAGGASLALAIPALPPADSRIAGASGHLRRAAVGKRDEWARALTAYASDLITDALELAPEFTAVAVPESAPFAETLAAAAADSGLACVDFPVVRYVPFQSVEIRLLDEGDVLASRTKIGAIHREVAMRRESAWLLVAELHELLISAAEGANRGRAGAAAAEALSSLGREIREVGKLRSRAESAYRGWALPGAVKAELARLVAPLREQHALLGSRLAVLRSIR